MNELLASAVAAIVSAPLSPGPWRCDADGTVTDAAGDTVCVLGDPLECFDQRARANGTAILAVPEMLAALKGLLKVVRPTTVEIPIVGEWWAAVEAVALAEGRR